MSFTVISCFTEDFSPFADQLKSDCERLGYAHHIEQINSGFDDLISIFDFKVKWIRECVEKLGRVLWLDVECRLIRPVPQDWVFPFVSCYGADRVARYPSSGVLGVGRESLDLLTKWEELSRRFTCPDDFVLEALMIQKKGCLQRIPIEFTSRKIPRTIVRGQWDNNATVIQHPTTNRWIDPIRYKKAFGAKMKQQNTEEAIQRARKQLFFRNYGGDFGEVDHGMQQIRAGQLRAFDWVFDFEKGNMAPEIFWPQYKTNYHSKPVDRKKYLAEFQSDLKNNGYRKEMINDILRDIESSFFKRLFCKITY